MDTIGLPHSLRNAKLVDLMIFPDIQLSSVKQAHGCRSATTSICMQVLQDIQDSNILCLCFIPLFSNFPTVPISLTDFVSKYPFLLCFNIQSMRSCFTYNFQQIRATVAFKEIFVKSQITIINI
jgi:hypothetical protein